MELVYEDAPVPQKIVLFSELNSHKVHSISQNNCQVHRAGNTAAFDEPELPEWHPSVQKNNNLV